MTNAEDLPIVAIIVRLIARPEIVLAGIVLGTDERAVSTTPETGLQLIRHASSIDRDDVQLLAPGGLSSRDGPLKVPIWLLLLGIGASLVDTDEAHTHTGHDIALRLLETDERPGRVSRRGLRPRQMNMSLASGSTILTPNTGITNFRTLKVRAEVQLVAPNPETRVKRPAASQPTRRGIHVGGTIRARQREINQIRQNDWAGRRVGKVEAVQRGAVSNGHFSVDAVVQVDAEKARTRLVGPFGPFDGAVGLFPFALVEVVAAVWMGEEREIAQ